MTADLWKSLYGGMLIGAGAATLLLLNGKIAGISGIAGNVVGGLFGGTRWRLAFLIGLVLPAAMFGLGPITFAQGLPGLAGGSRRAPEILRTPSAWAQRPSA